MADIPLHLLSSEELHNFALMNQEDRERQLQLWRTVGVNPNVPPAPNRDTATLDRPPAPPRESAPPIDPALVDGASFASADDLKRLKERFEEFVRRKRHRGSSDDTDSSSGGDSEGPSKRSNGSSSTIILSGKASKLTEQQACGRLALKRATREQYEALTGITKKLPLPGPTEMGRVDHGGIELFVPNLEEDVTHEHNRRIITRVVDIVFAEQTNPEAESFYQELRDVPFTRDDIRRFATSITRKLRTRYKKQTDPVARAKAEKAAVKLRRTQRKRTACKDYEEAHGKNPKNLVVTDFMASEESDYECSDRVEKATHDAQKYEKARFSQEQIDRREKLWEEIKPGFRSAELSNLYGELDVIYRRQVDETKNNAHGNPRVNLDRVRETPPGDGCKFYPMMVDRTWYDRVVARNDDLKKRFDRQQHRDDPEGFGSAVLNETPPANGSTSSAPSTSSSSSAGSSPPSSSST